MQHDLLQHGRFPGNDSDPDSYIENLFCAWHDYTGDASLTGGPVSSPYGDIAFTDYPEARRLMCTLAHGGRLGR